MLTIIVHLLLSVPIDVPATDRKSSYFKRAPHRMAFRSLTLSQSIKRTRRTRLRSPCQPSCPLTRSRPRQTAPIRSRSPRRLRSCKRRSRTTSRMGSRILSRLMVSVNAPLLFMFRCWPNTFVWFFGWSLAAVFASHKTVHAIDPNK